jgi:hypothetical protein
MRMWPGRGRGRGRVARTQPATFVSNGAAPLASSLPYSSYLAGVGIAPLDNANFPLLLTWNFIRLREMCSFFLVRISS